MLNLETLEEVERRFGEITDLLSRPEVTSDPSRLAELAREHSAMRPLADAVREYRRVLQETEEVETLRSAETDTELAELVAEELATLNSRAGELRDKIQELLLPSDPNDKKNAIVEIRAGTGGDEASLFAGDLFRLYSRFGETRGWKEEILSTSPGSQGGFKEIVFSLEGEGAFGTMKFESGVHRVQRVPVTESSGRIHTSAATVAVLPEAEEVDVSISPEEIEVDVYRSSGPGGQSVNTTDSAVRITHTPTGLVVTCQDEKSQHKNKEKALRVLRTRLFDREHAKRNAERSAARKSMVGSGDRSGKIRTYNWPQSRVTDHRLEGDVKNYALQPVLDGELEPIHRALKLVEKAKMLAEASS
jgi:peptide chain release factor 1